jgi:GNAT superfamily N-acetyltransferase
MAETIRFRRYDSRDTDTLLTLDEWAMTEAGTDPADIPGSDDIQSVAESYLESGGDFVVGILPHSAQTGAEDRDLTTYDGQAVAMGGFLPNESGYDDERSVSKGAELHRMRVAPTHQGRGYGRELVDELERRALDAGFDLLLATTARRQERAVQFYSAAGYEEINRSEYGEYELVHFEKRLDD